VKVTGPDGALIPIRVAFTNHVFGPWLSPQAASLGYAITYTLFWLLIFSLLYRRRIFIKV
jgi:predicted acyltransferase